MTLPAAAAAILTAPHHSARTRLCQHLTVLGSPIHLAILACLDDGPKAAATLAVKVGPNLSYVVHALRTLVRSGLAAVREPGEPLYHLTPYGRALLGALASVVADVPTEGVDHA